MTGQHRNPRPPLWARIAEWFEHLGDRHIDGVAGDITDPGWQHASVPDTAPPTALDHVHQDFDADGECLDYRCGLRLADDPRTQVVRDVPLGEPDWMPAARA